MTKKEKQIALDCGFYQRYELTFFREGKNRMKLIKRTSTESTSAERALNEVIERSRSYRGLHVAQIARRTWYSIDSKSHFALLQWNVVDPEATIYVTIIEITRWK